MSSKEPTEIRIGSVDGRQLLVGAVVVCVLTGIADVYHLLSHDWHPHIKYESWFNFYGFFALLITVGCVWAARFVRPFIGRKEDYYAE